jgi:NADPH-dependent curcumin reductase CurA
LAIASPAASAQEFAIPRQGRAESYTRCSPADVSGVLGCPMTAYFGLDTQALRETRSSSGAAGAVNGVGQIAKIGLPRGRDAGGVGKCRVLTSEFGFDAAIDYGRGCGRRR